MTTGPFPSTLSDVGASPTERELRHDAEIERVMEMTHAEFLRWLEANEATNYALESNEELE